MAYQADILINVRGFQDLGRIQKALEGTAYKIDQVNQAAARLGAPVRNIERFTNQLVLAEKALSKVAIGSPQEQRAISNYVTALTNSNTARSRQNKLIQEEINKRNAATNAIRANVEANIAESRATRAARDAARSLNAELAQQERLRRNLEKRGLMQLSGGGIARGVSDAGFGVQGPKISPTVKSGGAGKGVSSRLENIALGVGFPLLFGGGAGEVLGSLAGSFVGTGFGGQIFGGAIGGILDDFITKTGELGAALNPATADIEKLVEAVGGVTTAAGAYIAELEKLERSQEALAVATAELENLVGVQGVEALKQFGDDSTKLQTVFSQAMTQMQAGVANLINSTGILKALTDGIESGVLLQQALQSQDPRQRALAEQRRQAGGAAFLGARPEEYFEAERQLIENQRLINAEKDAQYRKQKEILTAEQEQVEILKKTKELASEIKTSYNEILNEAKKRIQIEQAAVDRGSAIAKARYEAELAINEVQSQRLQRAYDLATTEQQRYDIAIALFNTQVKQATIEYQQQLESIAAEERKLQLELTGLLLAQDKIKLKADEARLNAQATSDGKELEARLNAIDKTTNDYLSTNKDVVDQVGKQLEAQREIAEYQKITAAAQLEGKIIAAQTALEQKLVSDEIGMSQQAATKLSNALANGVITSQQMASTMSSVAVQAGNAAVQINRALNTQIALNAAQAAIRTVVKQTGSSYEATYDYGDGSTGYAKIQAHYASGGFVNKATRALIGEAGPEYVVPARKARAFSMRYLAGARGESALATNGRVGGNSVSVGGNSVSVNIQTGPVMQQDGVNYITVADLQKALQDFGEAILRNNRTYGGRRYQGVTA